MTPGSLSFGFSKLACSYRVRMLGSLRGEQRLVANGGTPTGPSPAEGEMGTLSG